MRLNFNGAIAGLGRGLATLGTQGIEEEQRVAADQRLTNREQAMARLNQTLRTENDTLDRTRDIRSNEIRDKQQFLAHRAQITEVDQPAHIAQEERTEGYQQRRDDRTYQRHRQDVTEVPIDTFLREVNGELHMIHVYRGGREVDMGLVADTATRSGRETPPQRRENGTTGNYDEYIDGVWVDSGVAFPSARRRRGTSSGNSSGGGGAVAEAIGQVQDVAINSGRGRQTLTAREGGGQARTTARVGQIVRDPNGRRFRVGPNNQMIPLD